jgi:two-component system nitrogen regulation response regulator GlnG
MLPGTSGLDVFQQIRKMDRRLPVVFITAGTDTTTTIKAMQLGGFDYVAKPLDLTTLANVVEKAIQTHQMMMTPVAIAVDHQETLAVEAFIGRSAPMVEVLKTIGRVAAQNVPVLILGESGTGKELVARAVYQNSDRSNETFYAVNCAALPDALLESELFGHEKGAFTGADKQRIGKFEACNGGTIFLDEVGDMSPLVQGKVLRLLQQQEFQRVGGNLTITTDVRIIAATNLDLTKMVRDGDFREDLLYRLNGVTINLPPLRDRIEDIPMLLQYFMRFFAKQMKRTDIEGLSPEALAILASYSWPGNVRQLQSVMRQSILNATGPVIVPSFLPAEVQQERFAPSEPLKSNSSSVGDLTDFVSSRINAGSSNLYAETVEQMERYLLTHVLQVTEGNQSRAAEILGITRGKIRDRVRQFGILVDKQISIDD